MPLLHVAVGLEREKRRGGEQGRERKIEIDREDGGAEQDGLIGAYGASRRKGIFARMLFTEESQNAKWRGHENLHCMAAG